MELKITANIFFNVEEENGEIIIGTTDNGIYFEIGMNKKYAKELLKGLKELGL